MALEFNVTEADRFFLGEDKVLSIEVFGQDNVTPLDVATFVMEWSLKKKETDPDPPLIDKKTVGSAGITVAGTYSATPGLNAQRVLIALASDDTDPFVTSALPTPYKLKAKFPYPHSLKRRDPGNEGVLSFGTITFKQATEP